MMHLQSLLQWLIVFPLLAAGGVVLAGKRPNLREGISLVTAALVVFGLVILYQGVSAGDVIQARWLELLPGLSIAFRVESLGLLFAFVAGSLWFVTTVYSIGYMRGHHESHQTRFYGFFAVSIAAVMGIAFAENLFTLFIFYEVLTLCTYPLVTHAGTDGARQGGRVYLGILLGTSILFFLPAIIGTWVVSGTLSFTEGGVFSDGASTTVLSVLLLLFAFGIGKAALMPFHRWLPAAMVAPTPVSALLHAVAVVKAGVFTFVKICAFIFGLDTLAALPITQWLMYLAGLSILLASLVAMSKDNLKARLAYSTVSQLGYITLGALLATASGITGSAMHIAMHAFGKITLFFCAGAILVAAHKTEISEMEGLGQRMPVTMAAFLIASVSIIGLPPGGGTWSKWYLLGGTLEAGQWVLMSVLMLSTLLNIAYLLPIPLRAFFPSAAWRARQGMAHAAVKEAPLASVLALSTTAVACVVLFIYPQILYGLVNYVGSEDWSWLRK
ncbi:MAG: monovalent cation/H+ antiporter subunit D family protein [Pseudohongiellaceae bacterium]